MTHWRLFGLAFALPVLFTAFVLIEVATQPQRRSSEGIDLTEREVTLSGDTDENSGMTARVRWAVDAEAREVWLSPEQLEALGFDLAADRGARGGTEPVRQLERRAVIAFELRRAGGRIRGSSRSTRLSTGTRCWRRYPNRRTHLVTAGLVGLRRDAGQSNLPRRLCREHRSSRAARANRVCRPTAPQRSATAHIHDDGAIRFAARTVDRGRAVTISRGADLAIVWSCRFDVPS